MGARSVEITTERLLLRPIREDDAADVLAYASDPNVAAFTSWRNHESIDDARAYVQFTNFFGSHAHGLNW